MAGIPPLDSWCSSCTWLVAWHIVGAQPIGVIDAFLPPTGAFEVLQGVLLPGSLRMVRLCPRLQGGVTQRGSPHCNTAPATHRACEMRILLPLVLHGAQDGAFLRTAPCGVDVRGQLRWRRSGLSSTLAAWHCLSPGLPVPEAWQPHLVTLVRSELPRPSVRHTEAARFLLCLNPSSCLPPRPPIAWPRDHEQWLLPLAQPLRRLADRSFLTFPDSVASSLPPGLCTCWLTCLE